MCLRFHSIVLNCSEVLSSLHQGEHWLPRMRVFCSNRANTGEEDSRRSWLPTSSIAACGWPLGTGSTTARTCSPLRWRRSSSPWSPWTAPDTGMEQLSIFFPFIEFTSVCLHWVCATCLWVPEGPDEGVGAAGVSGFELSPCGCRNCTRVLWKSGVTLNPRAVSPACSCDGVAVYSSSFQIPVVPLTDVSVERRLREEGGVKGARGEHTGRRISVPWKQKGKLLLRGRQVRAEGNVTKNKTWDSLFESVRGSPVHLLTQQENQWSEYNISRRLDPTLYRHSGVLLGL